MRKIVKKVWGAVVMGALVLVAFAPVAISGLAWADEGQNGGGSTPPETTILPNTWGVKEILDLVLNIVVYGLGAAAVLGTVIAGIMYLTARDSEAQVAKAKTRLIEVVIGLVAWALMYVVLKWLIPGFNL